MHFVYHPHHEAVIVSPEEYQQYLDSGWYDTPDKFPKNLAGEEAPKDVLEAETKDVSQPKKKGRPRRVNPEEVHVSPAL